MSVGDYFYTVNRDERDLARRELGYVSEGGFRNPLEGQEIQIGFRSLTGPNVNVGVVELHRFLKPGGGHFFTINKAEGEMAGFTYEERSNEDKIYVYRPGSAGQNLGTALFRLVNPATGAHLYSVDGAEKDGAQRLGFQYEGVHCYVIHPNTPSSLRVVYRLRKVREVTRSVTLHFRSLVDVQETDKTKLKLWLNCLKEVFSPAGFRIAGSPDTIPRLSNDNLKELNVAGADNAPTSEETKKLRELRNDIPASSLAVFFVETIKTDQSQYLAGMADCAFNSTVPPAVIAVARNAADRYVLAHELGHVLGLSHASNSSQLMWDGASVAVAVRTAIPPVLSELEVSTMQGNSAYATAL